MSRGTIKSQTVAAPVFEPLETRTMFAAGAVDFVAQVPFNFADVTAHDAVVQGDGKTVMVGTTADGRMAVARINAQSPTKDTTFGPNHDGQTFARVGGGNYMNDATAVALDRDGDILVAGTVTNGGNSYAAIVRFLPNGQIDPSFGGDASSRGFVMCDLDGEQAATISDMAIEGDGKILVVGSGFNSHLFGSSERDMIVGRFNANGTLDKSFGDGGHRFIGGRGGIIGSSLAVDYSTGNIVAVGTTIAGGIFQFMAVGRLNSNGNFDSSFHGGQTDFVAADKSPSLANGVTIQSGGRIVITGAISILNTDSRHAFATVRLLSNGQLDHTFGQIDPSNASSHLGWVVTRVNFDAVASDIMENVDGDLIVAGTFTAVNGRSVVAKYTANGDLDTSFGQLGLKTAIFNDHAGFARLAAGPGRRFVAIGGSLKFNVIRFLDTGARQVFATGGSIKAAEHGQVPSSFIVYREENLPWPTRVFFSIGGTATAPSLISARFKTVDYALDGLSVNPLTGTGGYVDIPAGQTFTVVTLTPIDDARLEGNETATFNITSNASYDIGNPSSVNITIQDDLLAATKLISGTTNTGALTVKSVWSEIAVA
jgi:uncharacterized delta-60 repeat protein